MTVDLGQFLEAFLIEAAEHLEEFEATLLLLERHPGDRELLNTIFRCAHSIKGGAATFGLPDVARFTHSLETLLDEVRTGNVAVDASMPQLLLRSVDQIRALLAVAKGELAAAPPSEALVAQLDAAARREGAAPSAAPAPTAQPSGRRVRLRFEPTEDILLRGCDPLLPLFELSEVGEVESVVCDASRLPALEELDPVSMFLAWEVVLQTEASDADIRELFDFVAEPEDLSIEVLDEPQAETVETPEAPAAEPALQEPAAFRPDASILRVPSDKMDRLVNLVGELVISQSMLTEALQDVAVDRIPRLADAVASMERTCRELQERVMSIRLVPLRQAFGRFPRLVRDLGQQTGKRVEFTTAGEDTELDKTLIEAIVDPLTHLIRNAIDHGLETPEDRRAAGKPEVGRLTLSACNEGGSVVIEVADDGRGLNRERILRKAVERGLVAPDANLSDDAINNMIFAPGFSTAAAVTDLSGRGVGMDIVRSAISDLNGTVTLSTNPGQGTRFRIRLPLTMAIMEGLTVRIGEETYIIPLTSIVESLRPSAGDLKLIAGSHEVVTVRGEVLPVLRLHRVFNIAGAIHDPCEGLLVIVDCDGRRMAILVDDLVTQNQAVVKSLEANYRKVEGLAGATILGDGRIALILDVASLVQSASPTGGMPA